MRSSLSKLMSNSKTLTFSAALFAAAAPAFALGCSGAGGGSPAGSSTVGASATVYNRSTHALTAGSLTTINGTYTGCAGHADADPWSIITGGTMSTTPLTVAAGDTACSLSVTSLLAGATTYTTGTPIVMTDTLGTTASAYSTAGAVAFYANADLSAVTFAADFVVQILTSDDPAAVTGINNNATSVNVATATQAGVPAPNYTLTGSVAVGDSAGGVVQTTSGTEDFTDGTGTAVEGQLYVVKTGTFTANFANDDAAFIAGTKVAANTNPSIPSASLVVPGDTLPQIRTVIFQNLVNDVPSYQTFQITFNP